MCFLCHTYIPHSVGVGRENVFDNPEEWRLMIAIGGDVIITAFGKAEKHFALTNLLVNY